MLEKLKKQYKNIVIIVGIAGIVLIFASTFTQQNSSYKESDVTKSLSDISNEEYKLNLENNLKDIICNIKGVGNVSVMITMESTTQKEYATEKKINTESASSKTSDKTETSYIKIKDSDGTEHAIPITEYAPKIRGVVVICDGGDQPFIKERVTQAVVAAVDVSSNHVCVTR